MNFFRPNLTLVIDRRLYRVREDQREPLSLVEAAIDGGVTMVQLRLAGEFAAPAASAAEELAVNAIAQRIREMTAGRVPFLVTSDLQLAERARADGLVLVGERTYRPSDVKEYLHSDPDAVVGHYAASVPAAARAERGGADFVQIGPAFDDSVASDGESGDTGMGMGVGVGADERHDPLSLIRKAKDAVNIPIVAIGGIDTPERAAAACHAGADGVAVTHGILDAPDPRAAAAALLAAITAAAVG